MFLEPEQVWIGGVDKGEVRAITRRAAIFGGGDGLGRQPPSGFHMAIGESETAGVVMFCAGPMIEPARVAGVEAEGWLADIERCAIYKREILARVVSRQVGLFPECHPRA